MEGTVESGPGLGVGIDVEQVQRFAEPPRGLFTAAEESYCAARPNPAESFAGTWAAKESVVKALAGWAAVSLREVEVLRDASGAPHARLLLSGRRATTSADFPEVRISISHAGDLAVAVAVATWQAHAGRPV